MNKVSRRKFLKAGVATAAGAAGLGVASELAQRYGLVPPDSGGIYGPGETLTYAAHRTFSRHSLAREFPRNMISKDPFANSIDPLNDDFKRLQTGGFADWRLSVEGMVAQRTTLSLSDLKTLPVRSQITEVVCEEGWSYVAEWIGTPLHDVLKALGVLPQAKYLVYFSIQPEWWDSIDMDDALHPQTLLVWAMNGGDLPVSFGGPLRMRLPRQLGYKSVKFLTRVMATDSVKGYVPALDPNSPNYGYSWYAGI
jgi:DMSO/TMAO reductase YedYZ molybdopterin-dependent catalytic subunit